MIKIEKEPDEFKHFPLEYCFFCGSPTKYWAKKGDTPVCPKCSKLYEEEDIEHLMIPFPVPNLKLIAKEIRCYMTTKQLYYGQYNYQNEIHKMWTRARSPAVAHRNFIAKLTKLLGISGYRLRCYFNEYKDNFKIKKK